MNARTIAVLVHNVDRALATAMKIDTVKKWSKLEPERKNEKLAVVTQYLEDGTFPSYDSNDAGVLARSTLFKATIDAVKPLWRPES